MICAGLCNVVFKRNGLKNVFPVVIAEICSARFIFCCPDIIDEVAVVIGLYPFQQRISEHIAEGVCKLVFFVVLRNERF